MLVGNFLPPVFWEKLLKRGQMSTSREEKEKRLVVCKEDLEIFRQAKRDIARGKKKSYAVGTRQAAAYDMTIPQLEEEISRLLKEIADLEAELEGRSARVRSRFAPSW